jgi:hypothetical protein
MHFSCTPASVCCSEHGHCGTETELHTGHGNCYFFVEVSRLFHSVIKFVIWATSKQNLQKQISVWINISEGELHMNNMSFLTGKFSFVKDMFSLT